MPATTDGVDITLAGETVTLRYTLGASKAVCAHFGGFSEAFARVFRFDANAFDAVVAAGLDKKPDQVSQDVFAAGYDTLFKDLTEYLGWLSNGGRAPNPVKIETDAPGNV